MKKMKKYHSNLEIYIYIYIEGPAHAHCLSSPVGLFPEPGPGHSIGLLVVTKTLMGITQEMTGLGLTINII